MPPTSGVLKHHPQAFDQFGTPISLRLAQVLSAVLYCLFASGVIFGYAAIKPVLISEGVYRHLCTAEELETGARVCRLQELRLNLMFNIAAVTTNAAALPIGATLDRFGPRTTSLIGCVFLLLGSLTLAITPIFPPESFDGYIPGYLLLALGGPCIFISTFQLSNAFPVNSGLVLSCLTGAFDASSAIWLGYRIIYQATAAPDDPSGKGAVSLSIFFGCYCAIPVIITVLQFSLMPKESYKSMGELVTVIEQEPLEGEEEAIETEEAELSPPTISGQPPHTSENLSTPHDGHVHIVEPTEHSALLPSHGKHITADLRRRRRSSAVSQISAIIGEEATETARKKEEKKRAISGVWGALHGKTVLQQISTGWFILVVLFTMLQMLRTNYFIATIRPQYEYLLRSWPLSVQLNGFFDIALPLGGLLSIPFIGVLLDYTSTPFTFAVLVITAATIGLLGIIPRSMAAGYANVVLFVAYRPFFYTSISDYCAKVFGFQTFGTLYGLVICTSGLFNLVQSALDTVTVQKYQGNPIPVNLGLLCSGLVVGVTFVAFVASQVRRIKRARAREALITEAEEADELLPDPARTYR